MSRRTRAPAGADSKRRAEIRPRAVRLGLVGAGPWGRKLIAAIARQPDIELCAVASRSSATRSIIPESCVVHEDWRTLMGDAAIEGVVIATPPARHAEMAIAGLAAGKAVFVEKPLALDAASAEAILDQATKSGAVAMTDHIHLFHPAYAELKRQLPALSPVHGLRTRGGRRGPFRPEVPVLWDWGPHDVAFALDLLGLEPKRVRAETRKRRRTSEGLGEILALRLLYDDGAAADLEFGNLYDKPVRELIVRCADCDVVLDEYAATPLVRLPRRETEGCLPEENAAEGRTDIIPVVGEAPLERALAAFADKIRAGRPDAVHLILGAAVTKVLARAEHALKLGKPA